MATGTSVGKLAKSGWIQQLICVSCHIASSLHCANSICCFLFASLLFPGEEKIFEQFYIHMVFIWTRIDGGD
jgi:hypothetical protein